MRHICINKVSHHWFRKWFIFNSTHWHLNPWTAMFINEDEFQIFVWKTEDSLSMFQCVLLLIRYCSDGVDKFAHLVLFLKSVDDSLFIHRIHVNTYRWILAWPIYPLVSATSLSIPQVHNESFWCNARLRQNPETHQNLIHLFLLNFVSSQSTILNITWIGYANRWWLNQHQYHDMDKQLHPHKSTVCNYSSTISPQFEGGLYKPRWS